MSYLVKRNGTFHYRRHVPCDVQAEVGRSWWKKSLKTGSQREADERGRALAVVHDQLIAHLRGLSGKQRLSNLEAIDDSFFADDARTFSREHQIVAQAVLDVGEQLSRDQRNQARTMLGSLSTLENALIDSHGGLDAFLTMAAQEAPVGKDHGDPLKREVQLRRLEPMMAIIRKLGITTHNLVGLGTRAHSKNPRLSDATDAWLKDRKQGASAAKRHRVAVRRFSELNGDVTVREITREMMWSYRDAIADLADQRGLPSNLRGGMEDGTRDGKPLPRVSAKTVERHLTTMKALLSWCLKRDLVTANLATGIDAPIDTRPKASKRRNFERSELKTLLGRVVEEEGPNSDKAWFVRLCAYTGIRIEEAAQLARKNVRTLDGVWIVDINDLEGRNLKSRTSVKQIPLHRAIRDEFVAWVQNGSGERVFASFRPYSDRYSHKLSGDFARLMDRAGLSDPRLTFHSLRHTLKREMSDAGVDSDMRRQILGHAPRSAHDGYTGGSVAALERELAKVAPLF